MTSDTAQKSRTSAKNADRQQAVEYLKESITPGDTVYVILRHVSKSGMSRWIDLYCINAQGQPLRITWNAAKALAMRYDKRRDALCVEGAGFDAAHSIVHDLAWTLFGNCDSLTHRWL